MVDAAVGGKTGINAKSGKNLIGSFYSPSGVLIDTNFLEKLPTRDLSAGMAEVIKCGFISDYKILNLVQDEFCLLYTSPSPRDRQKSRMPSSA